MIAEAIVAAPGFRVRLAPATVADTRRMHEAIVPEAARNLSFFSEASTLERQHAYLAKMERSESDLLFVIEDAEKGMPVGAIGLHEFDHANRNARIGMLIFRPEERGKGYSREAMSLIMRHAFRDLRLHKLYVRILKENHLALTHYLKTGFKVEGVLREEYLLDGVFRDMTGLSLLAKEWSED